MSSEQYINYYVDDYIAESYVADELYFDGDYLTAGYYEGEEIAPQEATVTLTLAVTLTASVLSLGIATSNQSVAATFECGIDKIRNAESTQSTAFTVVVGADRTRSTTSTQNSEFTVTSKIGKLQIAEIDTIVAFTPTVIADAFKNHTAVLDNRFTQTAAVNAIRNVDTTLTNIVNLSLQGDKFAGFAQDISAQFSQIIQTNRTTTNNPAQLNTQATITPTVFRVEFFPATTLNTATSLKTSKLFGFNRPVIFQDTQTATYSTGKFSQGRQVGGGSTAHFNSLNLDLNDWQTIDLWVENTTADFYVFDYNSGSNIEQFRIALASTTLALIYVTDDGVDNKVSQTGNISKPAGSFIHIRARKVGSKVAFSVNGTAVTNSLFDENHYDFDLSGSAIEFGGSVGSDTNTVILDEMLVTSSASSGNFTTPTAAYNLTDQTDVIFLLHFDGSTVDDTTILIDDEQLFDFAFAQSATANRIVGASADFANAFSPTLTVGKVLDGASQFGAGVYFEGEYYDGEYFVSQTSVTATLTAEVRSFTDFVSTPNSQFTLSVSETLFKNFDADFNTAFTQSTNGTRTRGITETLSTQFTQTVSETLFKNFQSDLNTEFTSTQTGVTQRTGNADLDTAITQSVSETLFKNFNADLNTQFTVEAVPDKIVLAESDLSAQFAQSVSETLFKNFDSAIDSQFTQSVSQTVFKGFASNLDTAVSITTTAEKITGFDSEQSAQFALTVSGDKTAGFTVDYAVEATQITNAVANFSADIDTIALFSPTFTAKARFTTETELSTAASIEAKIGVIRPGNIASIAGTGLDTTTIDYGLSGPNVDVGASELFHNDGGNHLEFVASIWAKRDSLLTGNTKQTLFGDTTSLGTGLRLDHHNGVIGNQSGTQALKIMYSADSDEPMATWDNAVPQDLDWHQYLIRENFVETSPDIYSRNYELYVDGVSQGSELQNLGVRWANSSAGGVNIGNGEQNSGEPGTVERFDGGLAQFWMAVYESSEYTFNISDWYDGGYVEFGLDGTNGGVLPDPDYYNELTDPFTAVNGNTPTAASEPLYHPGLRAEFTIDKAQPVATFLFISNQSVNSTFTADITVLKQGVSTQNAEFTQTIVNNYNFDGNSTQSAQYTLTMNTDLAKTTGFEADLAVIATVTPLVGLLENTSGNLDTACSLSITAIVKPPVTATADLVVESTVRALAGDLDEGFADLNSAFAVNCVAIVKPPVTATADLNTAFTLDPLAGLTADASANLNTLATLECVATEIPPVTATADLNTAFTAQIVVDKLVQPQAVLSAQSTVTATAQKIVDPVFNFNIQATDAFTAEIFIGIPKTTLATVNTILTVGDIINLDPFRTLIIEQETRVLQISQETRIITIEQETRVNTIKGSTQ